MTQKTEPLVGIKYGWSDGDSGWGDGMNENLLKFSFLFSGRIDGIVSSLPTPTPISSNLAYYNSTDGLVYFSVEGLWKPTPIPVGYILTKKSDNTKWLFAGGTTLIDQGAEFSAALTNFVDSALTTTALSSKTGMLANHITFLDQLPISGHFIYDPSGVTSPDGVSVFGSVAGGTWTRVPYYVSDRFATNIGFKAGTDAISGATLVDGFIAARTLTGFTNWHGFADRTILNATGAGGYGAFDSTIRVNGSNAQDHAFSFQDRITYAGSGTMSEWAGLLSAPTHSGTGNVGVRYGSTVKDITKTSTGSVSSNIGYHCADMVGGTVNVAVKIDQSLIDPTAYALYAGGGARSYHKGNISLKNEIPGGAFTIGNADLTGFYADTSTGFTDFGAIGDNAIRIGSNSGVRLQIMSSANTYNVAPGSDNTQYCGVSTFRWAGGYTGTAFIVTSDERSKQQIEAMTEIEKRVAIELKSRVFKYKLNSEVVKDPNAKIHCGMIAQDVIKVFASHGLNALDYAIVRQDEVETQDGNVQEYLYGICYEELICFILAAL